MEYKLIRSARKTVELAVTAEGLLVRAPLHMADDEVRVFLERHREWIDKHMDKQLKKGQTAAPVQRLTMDDIRALGEAALIEIPKRVEYFAPLIGVSYNRICIRNQRSRWGSCSGKGNLNFNCLLMLTPTEVIDSVVVHELCHLKEPNHSKSFYELVLRFCPDYYKWNRWLKENGGGIIKRMTDEVVKSKNGS